MINIRINKKHFIKYFVQLVIVTIASYLLSPCKVKLIFALTLGFISASLFAILDTLYPFIIDDYNKIY